MKIKILITSLILFFAIIACIVPGISQPDAIPTYDVNMIPTMVVLTANALASQTAAAITPLPIETSTPTLVPAESVTATPKVSFLGT
jgi:hypothetical protein